MATNEFLPFATSETANVLSQAEYAALTLLLANGFTAGVASAPQVNKAIRQSTFIASVIGQFIADGSGLDALDDGEVANLQAKLITALRSVTAERIAVAAGTENAITAAFGTPVTALSNGLTVIVRAASANSTTTPTFAADATAAKTIIKGNDIALLTGDIVGAGHWLQLQFDTVLDKWVLQNPAKGVSLDLDADLVAIAALTGAGTPQRVSDGVWNLVSQPLSVLSGLVMSTAGASATMTIGAGQAVDSTGALTLARSVPLAKTTSAWSAGAGGALDTGAIANSTWYHWFLIGKADGTTDFLCSLSPTAPTLPATYTHFRRIGAMKTSAAGVWLGFIQDGNNFFWEVPFGDAATSTANANATLRTLSVPTGIQVYANYALYGSEVSLTTYFLITDPALPDSVPSASNFTQFDDGLNMSAGSAVFSTRTNTSAQVRVRATRSGYEYKIATLGWEDKRGGN